MTKIRLGKDAKFYRGTAGSTASTLFDNVMDLTVNLEYSEEDTTTRESGDFEISEDMLCQHSLEWSMPFKASDPDLLAVQAAFANRTAIALAALTGTTGFGIDADYKIRKFTRSEPVKGKIVYNVTAKPTDENRAPTFKNKTAT